MTKEEIYNLLYQNMNNGVYNSVVRTWEKNLAPSSEISVKLVKKACNEHEVDFDELLKYAQERKLREKVNEKR